MVALFKDMRKKGLVRNETTYEIVIPFFISVNRPGVAYRLYQEADGLGLQLAEAVEAAAKECEGKEDVLDAEIVHREGNKE
jgi:hypothetical protein